MAPPRPPSAGSARSGLSRPASMNCVSTASSTPRGAHARPQPSAPSKAVPRGKSKERWESFEQKLEKRDILVNCILNNEVPNRQRSVTPSRRQQSGTPRAAARLGNQGARTSVKARSRSQSIPPDDMDARRWSNSAAPVQSDLVEEAFRVGGNATDWNIERAAPLTLPSLKLSTKHHVRSSQQRLHYAATPISGSQSARSWRKVGVGL